MDAVIAAERPANLVLLGHPVSHSLSPVFQNAALEHCSIVSGGQPVRYTTLDVEPSRLNAVLDALTGSAAGGNVTIPHKEAVAARARCSPLASRVGAVNTFWHESGELVGHNTDVVGAIAVIQSLIPDGLARSRVVLLGAGGSAAAVLVALDLLECVDVCVIARDTVRAAALIARVGSPAQVLDSNSAVMRETLATATLVINATPIGLTDDAMPVEPTWLNSNAAVFDLVYRRSSTAWVRACRATNHRAADGLGMLLEQGAAAFECWFGQPAPRDVMRSALHEVTRAA